MWNRHRGVSIRTGHEQWIFFVLLVLYQPFACDYAAITLHLFAHRSLGSQRNARIRINGFDQDRLVRRDRNENDGRTFRRSIRVKIFTCVRAGWSAKETNRKNALRFDAQLTGKTCDLWKQFKKGRNIDTNSTAARQRYTSCTCKTSVFVRTMSWSWDDANVHTFIHK